METRYRGYVLDNVDPTKSGKVQVLVPAVSDEPLVNWATPCGSGKLGAITGFVFVPDIGSKVFVDFELGNFDYPIYTIGEWDDITGHHLEKASEFAYDDEGNPIAKLIKTKSGELIFKEKAGEEEISIEMDESDIKTGKRKNLFSLIKWAKDKLNILKLKENKKISEINLTDSDLTLNFYNGESVNGTIKLKKDNITIDVTGKGTITISSGGIKVDARKVEITGEVTLSGVQSAMPGFCSTPFCMFTGSAHTTNKVGM